MDIRKERLKMLLKQLGDIKKNIAGKVGISPQALNNYINPLSKDFIGHKVAEKFEEVYRVNRKWLLGEPVEMFLEEPKHFVNQKIISIPHVASVSCGLPTSRWEGYGDKFINIEFERKLNQPIAVTAKGNSMAEYILDGDKVFFEDVPMNEIKDGEIVLVNLMTPPDTSEGLIKFVEFDKKNELIQLWSKNSYHKPKNYREDEIYKLYRYVGLFRAHKPKR